MSLSRRLPLFSFLLEEFGAAEFEQLGAPLSNPAFEEPSFDDASRYYHELVALLSPSAAVDPVVLRGYDESISKYTEQIGGRRPEPIRWRYFQYLMLLFTERFLDRLFADQDGLLEGLNLHLEKFNQALPEGEEPVPAYERSDLRKLALWSATGSGKTLIMHINHLQVLAHYEKTGRRSDLNAILLLTPNEGLSRQHYEELALSGIEADLFSRDLGSMFRGRRIEIIDIHKLRDEEGEKSVAIDAFGDNNLVMVDEGHRGAGGEHWMQARERLCRNGFSLEYSATFGQAFAGKPDLENSYAKWIVFDYAYRRFHFDGYGKDFRILNYPAAEDTAERRTYLSGALLSFYQQQRYFDDCRPQLRPFNLERPLWAFVGSNVTANVVQTVGGQKVSDVIDILLTFARFLGDPESTKERLESLLAGGGGLLDPGGANIFDAAFSYLDELGLDGEDAYRDILNRFFNCSAPGPLRVVRLRGVDGELALQVGNNPPFGVINVGDAAALHRLCAEHEDLLVPDEIDADSSLFDWINRPDSSVNLVVGAKKFIEGWNSWRVSSLGLLRVGRGEGPQIVQLFGRGVRLKGFEFSLKRSTRLDPEPADRPEHIALLETLTVFGVKADYMTTFRNQLEVDGVAAEREILTVPVVIPDEWPGELRVIRPELGTDFVRQADRISLVPDPEETVRPAVVNWYARVEVMASGGAQVTGSAEVLNEVDLTPAHTAFFDPDRAYRKLARYKTERGWHNLTITPEEISELLARHDWYHLFVPPELFAVDSAEDIERWHEIVTALLHAWCERRIKDAAASWLQPRLKYVPLSQDDPNIIEFHLVSVPADDLDMRETFQHIAEDLVQSEIEFVSFGKTGAIQMLNYRQHLYRPLLYVHEDEDVILTPTSLNPGEARFLNDIHDWCQGPDNEMLGEHRLFVLRNQARGKGIGFLEAGNFYPDFIIWLLGNGVQRIVFVDPKGLVRVNGVDSPKIALRRTIKEVEARIGDPAVRLSSFIVSVTAFGQLPNWWSESKAELEDHHVLFQHDDPKSYVGRMMELAMADTLEPAGTAPIA